MEEDISKTSELPTENQQGVVPMWTTEQSNLQPGEVSQESFNVLITGAGSPGAVGIIKYLKSFLNGADSLPYYKVIGVDSDPKATGFNFCDKSFVIPKAKEKDFIPFLLEICEKEKVNIIFPKVTAELTKLSSSQWQFQKIGTAVLISGRAAILCANNKYRLFQKLKKTIPVPEFFFSKKRLCVKPTFGSGGNGFKILKGNNNLVMEYLSGKEYSVDILANQGEALIIVPRERIKIKAGVSVVGEVVEEKEIIEFSKKAVKKLKLHGIVGLQFKKNKKGVPVLLECNPRIQGTIMLSEMAGAGIFGNAIRLVKGENVEIPEIKWGIKMFRYWDEIFYG